ncbi:MULTISPECIES: hypothetical protein [Chryseobacterium]|uniref:Uncharacterized protein n=1 Tax=Chryseobacterium geocarposphaerae TaxID=1416776 RepID=A0ABU1LCW0_9FLAO|nr:MULTISPECIES: hypothetical protein [Chryseobacterium]MDR6404566.1 hypothetical protein [Chryseobacterium geocarposphaerae]MDR6698202.1 hypothetical protein [Chryseobacterium ginsenosidimutans]
MKNITAKALLFVGLISIVTSFSSNDDLRNVETQNSAVNSKEVSKTKTYNIRFGLLSQSGTKILSGSYDVGSFVATNNATGETFETYAGGGFQSIPKFYEGIPAGTYTFTAMQGQGGWVGYGSVTGEVSDAQVDADGYITVYIPIVWEE